MVWLTLAAAIFVVLSHVSLAFLPGYGRLSTLNVIAAEAGNTLVQDVPSPAPVPENWFHQKLDHFDPADNRYWQQRYFINDTFYAPGGPAFLFIGPESPLNEIYARTGAWLEYAKEYHAVGFALEHRYYGNSHPTVDLSTANLQYLTVEQTLEDLATFIAVTTKDHNLTDARWVTFGGSYAGMLSAWMRYKFPHLIAGAVAHSAPVALPLTPPEYVVGMGDDLHTVPGCYEAMSSVFDEIRNKLTSDQETKNLKDLFRFCDFDRNKKLDVENMMFSLFDPLVRAIQYSGDHLEELSGGIPGESISSLCRVLNDKTRGQPVERLADFVRTMARNYTAYALNGACIPVSFDSLLAIGNKIKFEDNLNFVTGRQWTYQACTQIGTLMTTESANQPFGNAVSPDYYFKVCEGYFGANFNKDLMRRGNEETLMNYGGLDIQATNVVYTQGSNDPWIKYGFTTDPVPRSHAIVVKDVGHAAALFSSSPLDSAEMKQARARIQRYIGQWISARNVGLIG